MKVDLNELNKRVEQKLISIQKHPEAPISIFNYTPKAQYSRAWDEYTRMARGLILDNEGNIIARPFIKFHNYEEHQGTDSNLPKLPNEEFDILEKLDGSLGILYWIDGQPYLATRGSFTSDQALWGTDIFRDRYAEYDYMRHSLTYLYEILVPQNRIVVDYGTLEDVVLLDVIDNETGLSVESEFDAYPFPKVEHHKIQPIDKLLKLQRDNMEGFVLRYKPSNVRVKIKHKEYQRLHKLLTQVSSYSIWELLKNDQPFDELLENVPDEYFSWVRQTTEDIKEKYYRIEEYSDQKLMEMPEFETRKEMAEYVLATQYPAVLFNMKDGKDYSQLIWKLVKPTYSQPFRTDDEK